MATYEKTKNFSQEKAYLVPSEEVRGIGVPYAQAATYFEASKLVDQSQMALGYIANLAIPSPIVGKYIQLPDGSVNGPGLSFASEVNSGRYRIGTNNIGEAIAGDLKFDWNASRLRLDSGFSLDIEDMTSGSVLFAGSGGRVSQDNHNLFWDDSTNRLGILTRNPTVALDVDGDIRDRNMSAGSVLFADSTGIISQDNTNFFWNDSQDFLRLTSTTGKQLQLRYNASNDLDIEVDSLGDTYIKPTTSFILQRQGNETSELWIDAPTAKYSIIYFTDTLSVKWSMYRNATNNDFRIDDDSDTRIRIYQTTGNIGFGSSSEPLFWDNANKQLDIYGTSGAQLKFGDSSTISVTHRFYDAAGAYDSTYIIDPASSITHDGAFCLWNLNGSDFSFSYGSGTITGTGVPNVTISGPPNTGTYTSASGPGLNFYNELEAVDNKGWTQRVNAKVMTYQLRNDANNSATNWLTVTRNGMTVSDVNFPQGLHSSSTVLIDNNFGLHWKDSGGTSRQTITLASDNNLYFDNRATGSHLWRGGSAAGSTTTFMTLSNAGLLTVSQYANVGTATDSATQGDLTVGLTGAARWFFDQSSGGWTMYNSSGTQKMTCEVQTNNVFFQMGGFASGSNIGYINFSVSGSDHLIAFGTLKSGVSAGERMRLDPSGNLLIGTTTSPSAGMGKVLVFGDNAAQPTMGSNTAGFYGYDSGSGTVEAWCVDEAGNDTQLSPHDEHGEWIFNSRNRKTGRAIKIRMERLVKYLVENGLVPSELVEESYGN